MPYLISALIALIATGGAIFAPQPKQVEITEPTVGDLRVLTAPQGGTGIGSATAGDVGKVIKVLDDSPFTYELAADNSGGGGSGGGTWSTTTSQVAGRLVNYPNNDTDIVSIGANSTTTSEWWYDPNTQIGHMKGRIGIGTTSPYAALSIVGEAVARNFTSTTTIANTFPNASTTQLSIDSLLYFDSNQFDSLTDDATLDNNGGDLRVVDVTCTDCLSTTEIDSTVAISARNLTVAGTANQITSSAGAQDLSADRTWTLSFPNLVIFPSNASSTLFSSTYASSTNQVIGGNLTFGGVTGSAWSTFCTAITGGAGLCDGTDATGGGSGGGTWSTTTSQVSGTLINYPNNDTDVVTIGANASTSAEFWFDPAINTGRFTGSATTTLQFVTGGINPVYRLGLSWIESTPSMSFLYDGSGTGNSNKLTIWDDSTLIERFTFQRGGNFGIGTTSPYAPLSVIGQAVASYFTATSTTQASTFPYASSTALSTSYASSTQWFGGGLLADCDTAATSKLLWDATTGQFSCGTDQNTGAGGGSGSVSTSTNEVANQVAVFTSNSATPALIGGDTDFTFSGNLLQITQASTTRGSCYGPCYFGATATSTFSSSGVLSLASALAVSSGGTGLTTFGGTDRVLFTTSADNLASNADFTFNASSATLTVPNNSEIIPAVNGGGTLGTASAGWSALHLSSGGVINWANSLVTLTHDAASDSINVGSGKFGVASTTPHALLSVSGIAGATYPIFTVASSSHGAYLNVGSTGTTTVSGASAATSTAYIYSTAASKGGSIILEDVDGAGCTEVSALNGVLSAAIVTCPTEI